MGSNLNRRKDYGKYTAPDGVIIKTAQSVEVGDIAITPSGLESEIIEKKLLMSKVELNEAHRRSYQITFASKSSGVISKTYSPNSSISILKTV